MGRERHTHTQTETHTRDREKQKETHIETERERETEWECVCVDIWRSCCGMHSVSVWVHAYVYNYNYIRVCLFWFLFQIHSFNFKCKDSLLRLWPDDIGRTEGGRQVGTSLLQGHFIPAMILVLSQPKPVVVDVEGREPEDDKDENGNAAAHCETSQKGAITPLQLTALGRRKQRAKSCAFGHLQRWVSLSSSLSLESGPHVVLINQCLQTYNKLGWGFGQFFCLLT